MENLIFCAVSVVEIDPNSRHYFDSFLLMQGLAGAVLLD